MKRAEDVLDKLPTLDGQALNAKTMAVVLEAIMVLALEVVRMKRAK